jgi:hypothetical protein
MSHALLVHACHPGIYEFHAILFTTSIFNIHPLGGLLTTDGLAPSPYQVPHGSNPIIGNLWDCNNENKQHASPP